MPSKELPPDTELRRAPLLEAQVEIEIAAGDLDRARSAAEELQLVAARFQSKALVAGAALARGRVRLAEGDAADAERHFSEAARLWNEVGAPYEAALARMGLAEPSVPAAASAQAEFERRAARTILDGIEAAPPTDAVAHVAQTGRNSRSRLLRTSASSVARATTGRSRSRGARCGCETSRACTTSRGFSPHPGREFHVLDLVAAESAASRGRRRSGPSNCRGRHSATPARCSTHAPRDAYRRRLAEIEDDIEQARALGDTARESQADAERDFLVRELSRAVGLGGRDRRAASASERARVGVTRAIRYAMARIAEHHPSLGEHLDLAIRTGTYCGYRPDPRTGAAWKF